MSITAHMKVNGFVLPVAPSSSERSDGIAVSRAISGKPFANVRHAGRVYQFATIMKTRREADAICNLFDPTRNGRVWSLDSWSGDGTSSPYSSKGHTLAGTSGTNFSLVSSAAKFGTYSLQVDATNNCDVLSDVGGRWTVMGWHSSDSGSTWTHYVETSDAEIWVDGVRNDSATLPWTTTTDGAWTLTGNGELYDDLVWLPFLIATSWPAELDGERAFSPLPALRLSGDFTPADYVLGEGEAAIERMPAASGGGWEEHGVASVTFWGQEETDESAVVVGRSDPTTNVMLWYDASDDDGSNLDTTHYTDGSTAGTLVDVSASGGSDTIGATGGTARADCTIAAASSGVPGIEVTGGQHYELPADVDFDPQSDDFTVIAVATRSQDGTSTIFMQHGEGSSGEAWGFRAISAGRIGFKAGGNETLVSDWVDEESVVLGLRISGGTYDANCNDTEHASGAAVGTEDATLTSPVLFARRNGAGGFELFFEGFLHELIITSDAKSDSDYATIKTALQAKWSAIL